MLAGDPVRMKLCTKPERWIHGVVSDLDGTHRYPIKVTWENGESDYYCLEEIEINGPRS